MNKSIVTEKGDDGFTDYPGIPEINENNRRIRKDHPYIEYLGTLDELDAFLALCEIALQSDGNAHFSGLIKKVREELFAIDNHHHTNWLEQQIATLEKENQIQGFVKTWTNTTAAIINIARTICRRCERALVHSQTTVPSSLSWLNRLSDLLFLLAVSVEKTPVN